MVTMPNRYSYFVRYDHRNCCFSVSFLISILNVQEILHKYSVRDNYYPSQLITNLQSKLYEMSRPIFLPLYRYLVLCLNKDTVNIIIHYLFGDTSRTGWSASAFERVTTSTENILSEENFDAFLKYELFENLRVVSIN